MKRIIALGAFSLAAIGGLTAATAAPMGTTVHQQKSVGAYRLTLQIGPAEAMSMHPKGTMGERMLGGKMPSCSTTGGGMAGMPMDSKTCNRHVELHVDNRRTGKVVTNAHVTIRLTNRRTHSVIVVPIMTMVGARQGMNDLHYGNNIYAAGGSYTVDARVDGHAASFNVNLK